MRYQEGRFSSLDLLKLIILFLLGLNAMNKFNYRSQYLIKGGVKKIHNLETEQYNEIVAFKHIMIEK